MKEELDKNAFMTDHGNTKAYILFRSRNDQGIYLCEIKDSLKCTSMIGKANIKSYIHDRQGKWQGFHLER